MSKKKVKELEQVNGKLENFVPTTLEQIWGSTGISRYGTLNESDYASQLDEMNKSDLQNHASKLGVMPIDNRNRLKDILIKEFRKHVASFQKPKLPNNPNAKTPNKKIMSILAEGR